MDDIAKSSTGLFDLPCGYLDKDGVLHTAIQINEMTGKEQNILVGNSPYISRKLAKICENCLVSVGPYQKREEIAQIVPSLTQGDRMFLVVAVRRVTLGDEMPITVACPFCMTKEKPTENKVTVNLSEMAVKKVKDPKKRVYEVMLPKAKQMVRMMNPDLKREEMMEEALRSGKDRATAGLIARIDTIGDHPATYQEVVNLSYMDCLTLSDAMADEEGGVDTEFDVTCGKCEKDFKTDIGVLMTGFFNPLAELRAWRTVSAQ